MTEEHDFEQDGVYMGELEGMETGGMSELMVNIDQILAGGFGIGIVLSVFTVVFYRLTDFGGIEAFTASSFIVSILSFMLAAEGLLEIEIPFLLFVASLSGLGYMYMRNRM